MVVPQTHDQDHAALHGLAHCLEPALLGEVVGVAVVLLGGGAVFISNGIMLLAAYSHIGGLDDFAILHVEPLDFLEVSFIGAVLRDELSHHSEGFGGVNVEARAWAVEGSDSATVGVQVAAILVTHSIVALVLVGVSALLALATGLALHSAGVGGVGSGDRIALPRVEFRAAGAILANS